MPAAILDEFASLDISRQRRYQLRKEKAGACRLCGAKAARGHHYCAQHLEEQRARCRKTPVKPGRRARPASPRDLI